jgi:molybdopterin converting factor small subunit
VNIYANEEDIRYLSGLDTPVSAGDVITLIPAIAGG